MNRTTATIGLIITQTGSLFKFETSYVKHRVNVKNRLLNSTYACRDGTKAYGCNPNGLLQNFRTNGIQDSPRHTALLICGRRTTGAPTFLRASNSSIGICSWPTICRGYRSWSFMLRHYV